MKWRKLILKSHIREVVSELPFLCKLIQYKQLLPEMKKIILEEFVFIYFFMLVKYKLLILKSFTLSLLFASLMIKV